MAKRKILGDLIFKKTPWHNCNICGDVYMEIELIDDEDIGYICEVCAASKKELDAEQEDIETMMRGERKMKAGIF